MAYVPANNVLQVELRGTNFLKELENVLYFSRGDTIEPAEVDALFDWLEAVFLPYFVSAYPTTLSWDEIYGTDLTTSSSPTFTRAISPPLSGTGATPGLPNNNAACISFRSAGRGRSSRGRNYVPGLIEGNVSGDQVTLGTINYLVAGYELLLGGGTFPSGWEWIILSRILNGLPRVAGLVQPVLDVLSTSLDVESQRGRLK